MLNVELLHDREVLKWIASTKELILMVETLMRENDTKTINKKEEFMSFVEFCEFCEKTPNIYIKNETWDISWYKPSGGQFNFNNETWDNVPIENLLYRTTNDGAERKFIK